MSMLFNKTIMPIKDILSAFRKYQKTNAKKKASYMSTFEEKMIYRTTKTENRETTPLLVRQVLRKYKSA